MPGGLGRISPQSDMVNVSMQHGGLSKDIWLTRGADKPTDRSREDSRSLRSVSTNWRLNYPVAWPTIFAGLGATPSARNI